MKAKPPTDDPSVSQVAGVAVLVSLFSFLYFFQRGDVLLYGDAVAHINIARRVFDSLTPGLLQLGTVWLPLPHVLMIPFLWSKTAWQNGAGGSIPSMLAYVFGVMGIFRLTRGLLEAYPRTKSAGTIGGWAAAFAFGANPNLIYMQSTAMTESLYLAFFIWAVVYFAEFIRALGGTSGKLASRNYVSLPRCASCLAGAEFTRYDGWFLAGVIGLTVLVIGLRRWQDRALRRTAVKFLLAISIASVLWLAYNRVVYQNALEFANGPYSAKAIEQRVQAPNPALHNIPVAAQYFVKSAQLNLAPGDWGRFWLSAVVLVLVLAAWARWKDQTQWSPLLLLWVPLIFYALSLSYGSVPMHVSTWWPFATFNQRYGLQLLPLFALSAGVLTGVVFAGGSRRRHGGKLVALLFALMVVSYVSAWRATPECLKEAQRNWQIRSPLNSAVQRFVQGLPKNSRYLMDLGEHVGVMEQAGIPLRQVINGENHRPWKKPTDPDGLWERALADPRNFVNYVVVFDGDQVDQFANLANLRLLTEIHATGQPHARIYATGANVLLPLPASSH